MTSGPLIPRLEALARELSSLYADPRVKTLYLKHFLKLANTEVIPEHAPAGVRRVEDGTKSIGLRSCSRFNEVESDYYSWPLQKRAFRLLAPSTAHLCKSIIFENTRWKSGGDPFDPKNAQYYCVIVQYVDKLNTQKLMNYVRDLGNKEIPKKYYNMRVAAEEKSFELSGYENNAVSPFGLNTPLPIIITENITKLEPPIFFLGAGHVDWKIAMPIGEFRQATGCFVSDLS